MYRSIFTLALYKYGALYMKCPKSVMAMVIDANNISAISWRPVLVVEEAEVLGENHRPWASNW
jgi:hypothetical protein